MSSRPKITAFEWVALAVIVCALGTLIAVSVIAICDKWPAVRVGPIVSAAAALATFATLAFAWRESRAATRAAERARQDAERTRRLQNEYERRRVGLVAVTQLVAIMQRMYSSGFIEYFASAGQHGRSRVADEMQTLIHSANAHALLINTSHTGQAAFRGFDSAQVILGCCPAAGNALTSGRNWASSGLPRPTG